jgi:hypothetical protein
MDASTSVPVTAISTPGSSTPFPPFPADPIMQFDLANLSVRLLGLPTAQSWCRGEQSVADLRQRLVSVTSTYVELDVRIRYYYRASF